MLDMTEFDPATRHDADPEGVLGATLCMLSCALTSGSTYHVPRIAANLEWLAANPRVGADLRIACRRLWQHWDGVCAQMDAPEAHAVQRLSH